MGPPLPPSSTPRPTDMLSTAWVANLFLYKATIRNLPVQGIHRRLTPRYDWHPNILRQHLHHLHHLPYLLIRTLRIISKIVILQKGFTYMPLPNRLLPSRRLRLIPHPNVSDSHFLLKKSY